MEHAAWSELEAPDDGRGDMNIIITRYALERVR